MGKTIIYLITIVIMISLVNASLEYNNPNSPKLGKWTETCSSGNYVYSVDFKDRDIICREDQTGAGGGGNFSHLSNFTDDLNATCNQTTNTGDDVNFGSLNTTGTITSGRITLNDTKIEIADSQLLVFEGVGETNNLWMSFDLETASDEISWGLKPGVTELALAGKFSASSLGIDMIGIDSNQITSTTGTVSLVDDNLITTGNIGTGTESVPSAKLEVNGSGVLLDVKNDTESFLFVNQTSRDVGINTNSPGYAEGQVSLHVVNRGNYGSALRESVLITGNAGTSNTPMLYINTDSSSGNAEMLRISSNGIVKFTVDNEGDVDSGGNLYFGNGAAVITSILPLQTLSFINGALNNGFLFYSFSGFPERHRVTMGAGANSRVTMVRNEDYDDLTIKRVLNGSASKYNESGSVLKLEKDIIEAQEEFGNYIEADSVFIVDKDGRVGVTTNNVSYPLVVGSSEGSANISIYSFYNVSATGYITRTSVFDSSKNVWDYINNST